MDEKRQFLDGHEVLYPFVERELGAVKHGRVQDIESHAFLKAGSTQQVTPFFLDELDVLKAAPAPKGGFDVPYELGELPLFEFRVVPIPFRQKGHPSRFVEFVVAFQKPIAFKVLEDRFSFHGKLLGRGVSPAEFPASKYRDDTLTEFGVFPGWEDPSRLYDFHRFLQNAM